MCNVCGAKRMLKNLCLSPPNILEHEGATPHFSNSWQQKYPRRNSTYITLRRNKSPSAPSTTHIDTQQQTDIPIIVKDECTDTTV